jgi:putative tricarboxylic transport membrane protein
MSDLPKNRLLRPETLAACGIIVMSALLLIPTFELRTISALLPATMLIGLILLAVLLLVSDQRKAAEQEAIRPITESPNRVIGAFLLILGYALATDFIGFYLSTTLVIPLVAWVFGYRNVMGLCLATAIVIGAIWLIFDFAMAQDFPHSKLWRDG